MFFERRAIVADARDDPRRRRPRTREAALAKLLPLQREDFAGIFGRWASRPVTIRSSTRRCTSSCRTTTKDTARDWRADARHRRREDQRAQGRAICTSSTRCSASAAAASASSIPEITEMQARAIIEAACEVKKKGIEVHPEIMIPLVGTVNELDDQARRSSADVADAGHGRAGRQGRLHGRHDDRDPARRAHRRRDRRGGRVLQLRHQRPDADDVRLSAATTPASSCRSTSSRRSATATRSQTLDQDGVGQLMQIGVEQGPRRRGRRSSSASAASTAASRTRRSSATASA